MKNIIYVATLVGISLLTSSCNFLNVEDHFKDTLSYDSVFVSKRNIERYLWATAANFPDEGTLLHYSHTPGPLATDEAFTTFGADQFRGVAYCQGEVTPDNLWGLGNWSGMYKIMRKSNLILSRMHEASDLGTTDKFEILGYTRFMRAYAYYHLLMNFGPVIIVGDEIPESNESPEYYNTHRATYDESIEYICSELEAAAVNLPLKAAISQFGRPIKGAAYGLIARLRLQRASPLYNGGTVARTYFGSWTRKIDGIHYVSQKYDEARWALAAARIMAMGQYELHTVKKDATTPQLPDRIPSAEFPEGAGGIDHFKSYSDMFTGEAISHTNLEYIWGEMSGDLRNVTQHSFNVEIMGVGGMVCVSLRK